VWQSPEPHAHHPIQNQGHETNQCMGANALWQPVVYRANLNVGFQYPKATLVAADRKLSL